MFCDYCGKRRVDNAKFCRHCGAKLEVIPDEAERVDEPNPLANNLAEMYLRKAAEHDLAAMYFLGEYYLDDRNPNQNKECAVEWLSNVADVDRRELCCYERDDRYYVYAAMYRLGMCYLTGQGVLKDESKACKLFAEASRDRDDACCMLGKCYQAGQGVDKDEDKAFAYFTQSAKMGNLEARNELSLLLEHYKEAAEQGEAEAQFKLGSAYLDGRGGEKNGPEAVKWLTKAAEQGHAEASFLLGDCYYKGVVGGKDYNEAAKWYAAAKRLGHAEAGQWLDICQRLLQAREAGQ